MTTVSADVLTSDHVVRAALSRTWAQLVEQFRSNQVSEPKQWFSVEYLPAQEDDESRKWHLGGDASWRTEFESLASIAARKLGYSKCDGAKYYWLDCLRDWMQKKGLDKDRSVAWVCLASRGEILQIHKVAEMSSQFCFDLLSDGTPESPISSDRPPTTQAKSPRKQGRTSKRREKIKAIIQSGVRALEYCKSMDEHRIRPVRGWVEEGWPGTYVGAWTSQDEDARIKWRDRISKEKTRNKGK